MGRKPTARDNALAKAAACREEAVKSLEIGGEDFLHKIETHPELFAYLKKYENQLDDLDPVVVRDMFEAMDEDNFGLYEYEDVLIGVALWLEAYGGNEDE